MVLGVGISSLGAKKADQVEGITGGLITGEEAFESAGMFENFSFEERPLKRIKKQDPGYILHPTDAEIQHYFEAAEGIHLILEEFLCKNLYMQKLALYAAFYLSNRSLLSAVFSFCQASFQPTPASMKK